MKRLLRLNLACNDVYYTACSLLVTLQNSCSKLHCQKGFSLILFSYKIIVTQWRTSWLLQSSLRLASGTCRRQGLGFMVEDSWLSFEDLGQLLVFQSLGFRNTRTGGVS